MEDARKLLDVTDTAYASQVAFGHVATEIAGYARDHGCARIVMARAATARWRTS